jgi:hypothetical protein
MYNTRVLWKIAFQMKIDNLVKIMICFVIFFLNFSYVWISFQSCVDLHVKNSNVDFRLNRVRIDFDRDRYVELFRIVNETNPLVFNWNEHEFMSNRSLFAKFMHFFEILIIFVDVFFINQNVNIIDFFEKLRVCFEFIAHFQ